MREYESDPSINLESSQAHSKESRFGNIAETIRVMEAGEPDILGTIDEVMQDIVKAHDNLVQVVNMNGAELVDLKLEGKEILCLFKPFSGENESTKNENGNTQIKEYYPRERFAFEVSEHFGLDLIPPTIIREINGQIGALQLLIDKNEYRSQQKIESDHSEVDEAQWDKLVRSDDFAKMMLLDFILLNCDRNTGNYLVKINVDEEGKICEGVEDDPESDSLIAIDHGMCMSSDLYLKVWGEKDGPIRIVTDRNTGVRIPEKFVKLLQDGLMRKEEFSPQLVDDEISSQEIAYMWKRVEMLLKAGVFLSKYNIKQHQPLLSGELAEHPQLFISA